MKPLRRAWNRLLGTVFGHRREADLADEIESHIQMQTEDNLRLGMAPAEARRAARLKFGGIDAAKETYREQRGFPLAGLLSRDLAYALRQLRHNPGFTTVVVLTLALGIGANTAIFSAMNAAMLRFLPVRDPHRLFFLNTTFSFGSQSGPGDNSLTEYILERLRLRRDVFSDLVAFAPIDAGKSALRYGDREPDEGLVDMVSGDFFTGLGVPPAMGRTFTLEDEAAHAPLAVLSYGYWSDRLASDPAVLGHAVSIKG